MEVLVSIVGDTTGVTELVEASFVVVWVGLLVVIGGVAVGSCDVVESACVVVE